MKTSKSRIAAYLAATTCLVAASLPAAAQTAAPPSAPNAWTDNLKFGLQIQGGIMGNAANPTNAKGGNFGHLFDDRANDFQLNQVLATMGRTLDPKATSYDFGFKLQGLFGTDARYTRWVNFGRGPSGTYQGDITEANVLVHTPWLTEGGIDLKIGMFVTPMGLETIDPVTNAFYSKSYIFNFGLPLKHTGVLATTHVNDMLDIYTGIDSGVNTTLFPNKGDNNSAYSFMGGVGLNMMGGDLMVLALTHIGPENAGLSASRPGGIAHTAGVYRYIADILTIWKVNEKLTLTNEINYIHDEYPGVNPTAFGTAVYAGYELTDMVTLNARAEVFHDDKNFFVAAFPGPSDFNNFQTGRATGPIVSGTLGKATTYGAITIGATIKPPIEMLKMPGAMLVRPEVRYDTSLNGQKPFNGGKDAGAFTFGADFVLTF
jgi:hypothetical protein